MKRQLVVLLLVLGMGCAARAQEAVSGQPDCGPQCGGGFFRSLQSKYFLVSAGPCSRRLFSSELRLASGCGVTVRNRRARTLSGAGTRSEVSLWRAG